MQVHPETSLLIGSKSPPVSLETLNGDGFHLQDTLQSKSILLLFFSSKNYQSLKMISTIQQIKEGIRDSNIDYYLVNVFERGGFLKSYALDKLFTIPIVLDRYGISLKMFGSDIVPTTIVINKGGKISYYLQGFDDLHLENLILHLRNDFMIKIKFSIYSYFILIFILLIKATPFGSKPCSRLD